MQPARRHLDRQVPRKPISQRAAFTFLICLGLLGGNGGFASADEPVEVERSVSVPPQLQRWLGPQHWERDTAGPVLELGRSGEFDDTHLFAPCVARIEDEFFLWYSGSTGTVAERVFHLGLARSEDGKAFTKQSSNPVFTFGDGRHSVLTATLLRDTDGTPLREHGKLRMWFSSTDFTDPSGLHTLHETTSEDGIHWSKPSAPLLPHVYAPTILKEEDGYRMWYTNVSGDPWVISLATSRDGRQWRVHPEPVLRPGQDWEQSRLFYPTVIRTEDVYLMWYGSYWSARPNTTALGMAASADGVHWYRHPRNPVLRPDPRRSWESHYTTSQSVIRFRDGSLWMWYASRTAPPFVHKYFAINTAHWTGPE